MFRPQNGLNEDLTSGRFSSAEELLLMYRKRPHFWYESMCMNDCGHIAPEHRHFLVGWRKCLFDAAFKIHTTSILFKKTSLMTSRAIRAFGAGAALMQVLRVNLSCVLKLMFSWLFWFVRFSFLFSLFLILSFSLLLVARILNVWTVDLWHQLIVKALFLFFYPPASVCLVFVPLFDELVAVS